jgi:hypothetical protein
MAENSTSIFEIVYESMPINECNDIFSLINITYRNKFLSNKSLLHKTVSMNLNAFVFMQMVTFIGCCLYKQRHSPKS